MKYIKYKVDLVRYYCRFLIKRKEFKSLLNCKNQSTQTLNFLEFTVYKLLSIKFCKGSLENPILLPFPLNFIFFQAKSDFSCHVIQMK